MKLRLAGLALGIVTGFVFAWARMTDPNTFHRMLALDSPRIYLLMAAAVGVAFAGARLVRGRRALLTGEPINWQTVRPARNHIVGSVLFGIGWGIADACPGPTAAMLGAGRVLAVAVAGGVLAGVALQPKLAGSGARWRSAREAHELQLPVI
jgi:uncharacterized protein